MFLRYLSFSPLHRRYSTGPSYSTGPLDHSSSGSGLFGHSAGPLARKATRTRWNSHIQGLAREPFASVTIPRNPGLSKYPKRACSQEGSVVGSDTCLACCLTSNASQDLSSSFTPHNLIGIRGTQQHHCQLSMKQRGLSTQHFLGTLAGAAPTMVLSTENDGFMDNHLSHYSLDWRQVLQPQGDQQQRHSSVQLGPHVRCTVAHRTPRT